MPSLRQGSLVETTTRLDATFPGTLHLMYRKFRYLMEWGSQNDHDGAFKSRTGAAASESRQPSNIAGKERWLRSPAPAPDSLNLLKSGDEDYADYAESSQLFVRARNSSPSAKVWDFSD